MKRVIVFIAVLTLYLALILPSYADTSAVTAVDTTVETTNAGDTAESGDVVDDGERNTTALVFAFVMVGVIMTASVIVAVKKPKK